MPSGIALLLLQSVSELIKRIAFLSGLIPDPLAHSQVSEDHPRRCRPMTRAEAR